MLLMDVPLILAVAAMERVTVRREVPPPALAPLLTGFSVLLGLGEELLALTAPPAAALGEPGALVMPPAAAPALPFPLLASSSSGPMVATMPASLLVCQLAGPASAAPVVPAGLALKAVPFGGPLCCRLLRF